MIRGYRVKPVEQVVLGGMLSDLLGLRHDLSVGMR